MKIQDKGDYFKVIWEDGSSSTYPKTYNGFQTKEELENWLCLGTPKKSQNKPFNLPIKEEK